MDGREFRKRYTHDEFDEREPLLHFLEEEDFVDVELVEGPERKLGTGTLIVKGPADYKGVAAEIERKLKRLWEEDVGNVQG